MKEPSKSGELSISRSVAGTWRSAALSSIASINRQAKRRRRFVSKGQYIARRGQKVAMSSMGAAMVSLGTLGAIATAMSGVLMIGMCFSGEWTMMVGLLFATVILGIGSSTLLLWGIEALKSGKEMDAGILVTRANIIALPAEESLVRASLEPDPEHAANLLRTAQPPQSTPPEEMVRVATGPQKR